SFFARWYRGRCIQGVSDKEEVQCCNQKGVGRFGTGSVKRYAAIVRICMYLGDYDQKWDSRPFQNSLYSRDFCGPNGLLVLEQKVLCLCSSGLLESDGLFGIGTVGPIGQCFFY